MALFSPSLKIGEDACNEKTQQSPIKHGLVVLNRLSFLLRKKPAELTKTIVWRRHSANGRE
jgi:hypothetical protein